LLAFFPMRATPRAAFRSDVDIEELARLTKNFSGAEIEGLVKSAASFALYGKVDVTKASAARSYAPPHRAVFV